MEQVQDKLCVINTQLLYYADDKDLLQDVANGDDVPAEGTSEWWNMLAGIRDVAINDFWDNLQWSSTSDKPCVIFGTLDLWSGRKNIIPQYCEDIEDAIRLCTGRDIEDYEVGVENGNVYVKAWHHGGCNQFTIKVLSNDGLDLYAEQDAPNGDGDFSAFLTDETLYEPIEYLY
jgi:hypothetical protein